MKKLEERRAQNKGLNAEQKESMEEEKLDEADKDVEKAEAEEEMSNVVKSEISDKSPLKKVVNTKSKDSSGGGSSKKLITARKVLSNDEKPALKKVISTKSKGDGSGDSLSGRTISRRKVSSNDEKSWPLKKVISTVSGDSNITKSLAEKEPLVETTLPNDKDRNVGGDKESVSNEPPSPFQELRVKSFEEIMELKRKRRLEQEGSMEALENVDEEESTAAVPEQANSSTVLTLSPPKRLKRIVRKPSGDDNDEESKVVSSSSAEKAVRKVQGAQKRTVFVMEKPSPSKQTTENGKLSFLRFTFGLTAKTHACIIGLLRNSVDEIPRGD